MKKVTEYIFLSVLSAMAIVSCDGYLDPGPQPTRLFDVDFEPGFNIIGVLRVDGMEGSSFVHVERVYHIEEVEDEFEPTIEDASVVITDLQSGISTEFFYESREEEFMNYTDSLFLPKINREYSIRIAGADLPELTGTTVVPSVPVIDSSSVAISSDKCKFTILGCNDAFMYDVVLVTLNSEGLIGLMQRIIATDDQSVEASFDLDPDYGTIQWAEIYAYDENLAFYLNVSMTIKPQSYQETATTVNGGYGCFGSVVQSVFFF
ncbi:MAG: hypothetical protein P9L92_06310 [Candidatus Electryonea clarkiae]|nr:hypothetical protein [Candidatus Electryonea clarkiae]MDP8287709.1 hypothetical protein [Candidatus Electryonea clarkiae]